MPNAEGTVAGNVGASRDDPPARVAAPGPVTFMPSSSLAAIRCVLPEPYAAALPGRTITTYVHHVSNVFACRNDSARAGRDPPGSTGGFSGSVARVDPGGTRPSVLRHAETTRFDRFAVPR